MDIQYKPSPNFGDRKPQDADVNILVLHHTAMNSFNSAVDWLCNKEAGVSAHYVIGKDGEIAKLVDEDKRAWHAGRGSWSDNNDVNSYSIGIELDNNGFEPFSAKLMKSLIELSKDIMARHNIPQHNVIAHADMALARKEDPNPYFPWKELKENGVGLFPEVQKSERVLFEPGSKGFLPVQTKLNNYGYDIPKNDVFDRDSQIVVTAFKRHFDSDACTLLKNEDNKPYWKVDLSWTEYDDNMLNALYDLKQQALDNHTHEL